MQGDYFGEHQHSSLQHIDEVVSWTAVWDETEVMCSHLRILRHTSQHCTQELACEWPEETFRCLSLAEMEALCCEAARRSEAVYKIDWCIPAAFINESSRDWLSQTWLFKLL